MLINCCDSYLAVADVREARA